MFASKLLKFIRNRLKLLRNISILGMSSIQKMNLYHNAGESVRSNQFQKALLSFRIVVLFFCMIPFFASGLHSTPKFVDAFQPYRPLTVEGYIQAWNVNFIGPDIRIYITYLISNVGPGDNNNGVSVLIYHKGQSFVRTTELTDEYLKAKPGTFGHITGQSELKKEGRSLIAMIDVPDLKINLRLDPEGSGIRLLEEKDDRRFLFIDVAIPGAGAEGEMEWQGKKITLKGRGGMEYLGTNASPHRYAKRFVMNRTYKASEGIFLGGYIDKEDVPHVSYALVKDNQILASGSIQSFSGKNFQTEALSGYKIASATEYSGNCKFQITHERTSGSFYVLHNISRFLQYILKFLFADPYVVHYSGQAEIGGACSSGNALIESSYFLINK